jgi:hypothetical protein
MNIHHAQTVSSQTQHNLRRKLACGFRVTSKLWFEMRIHHFYSEFNHSMVVKQKFMCSIELQLQLLRTRLGTSKGGRFRQLFRKNGWGLV